MKRETLAGGVLILGFAMALSGCSSKITMVSFESTSNNGGRSAIGFEANGSSMTTETSQSSKGELAAAMEGAQAALGAIRDAMADYRPDLSKEDSENVTTTTTTQTTNYKGNEDSTVEGEDVSEEVKISEGKEEASEDLDYKNKATYTSYGTRNGGRQAWRIPMKGPEYGDTIKVVFADGHTVIVKDTSHNYRESRRLRLQAGYRPERRRRGEYWNQPRGCLPPRPVWQQQQDGHLLLQQAVRSNELIPEASLRLSPRRAGSSSRFP